MNDLMNILHKEIRLFSSPLSFFFLAFSAMAMIPNYPPLVGAFFICLGIFYSYQNGREANDILYSALLPIGKKDVVRAKFIFTCALQIAAFLLFSGFTALRMALTAKGSYPIAALMNPNPAFLGFVLVIFALFNLLFLAAFFKTAYKIGMPFLTFCVGAFVTVGIGEALHYIPGLEAVNSSDPSAPLPWIILAAGAVIYAAVTLLSEKLSEKRFEETDL